MAQERQSVSRPEQGHAMRRSHSQFPATPRPCDGERSMPDARQAIPRGAEYRNAWKHGRLQLRQLRGVENWPIS